MIRSLQLRLLLSTSLAISAILGLLGLSVYYFMLNRLNAEFDESLIAKARTIASMVESNDRVISFDADLAQMPEFNRRDNPEFFEIWLSNGKVLAKSPTMHEKDLLKSAIEPNPKGTRVHLPDGRRGIQITLQFPIHAEHEDAAPRPAEVNQTGILALAARPVAVSRTVEDLKWLLTLFCTLAVVASGIVLVLIVRRTVQPVNQLASEIGSMQESDLSRRLDGSAVPSELAPVVEKMNALLARLDQSFTREKAFTADVAHELRTPLAGIALTLEVCRNRPRDSMEYESAIDECRGMTRRLQSLIENLLLLARADAGQLPLWKQLTDLHRLMQDCWLPLLPRIQARQLTVEDTKIGDCTARIDAEKMRIVLCNLLDNAVSYVNEGGTISWSVERRDVGLRIQITNTGSQISAGDAGKLFNRFYRGDPSRTDTGTHCGLGLSLCQRLIRLLDGQITIETSRGREFTARVELPNSL